MPKSGLAVMIKMCCTKKYCVNVLLCTISLVQSLLVLVYLISRKNFAVVAASFYYHGLRGSASPVLTATGFVNGRWQFSTPHRINTP